MDDLVHDIRPVDPIAMSPFLYVLHCKVPLVGCCVELIPELWIRHSISAWIAVIAKTLQARKANLYLK